MSELAIEYEKDFYGWLLHNAKLIRDGRFSEIDAQNVAEELEGMGRGEKRELVSRLAVLLAHLLKWTYQPQKRSKSWKYTITEQRQQVFDVLDDSPSLTYDLDEKFARAYKRAILMAAKETKLRERTFPANCPFSKEQTLDENFYPQ